ncbi:MAG: META domain-containing protein [Opitutales bacterium]|nr:META domain-containing protein [Opitutales bacterium]
MKIISKLFVAMSLVLLCACSTIGEYMMADEITGFQWRPMYVANLDGVSEPPNNETDFGPVYISFSKGEDGLDVRGMSGCNIFNGGLAFKGLNDVEFTKMLSTRRMGKYAAYEDKFLSALNSTNYMVLENGILYFCKKSDDGSSMVVLKFCRGKKI